MTPWPISWSEFGQGPESKRRAGMDREGFVSASLGVFAPAS
jgi:hypothetical protein